MKYEYKVVPFVGTLKKGLFSTEGVEAVSKQMQTILNNETIQGWEFYAMNDVDVAVEPGCLPGLFGAKKKFFPMDQLVFRRPVDTGKL